MALRRKKDAADKPEPQAAVVDDQGTETVGEFSAHTIEGAEPEVAELSADGCGPMRGDDEEEGGE